MIYYIRKVEQVTIVEATNAIELNAAFFKNLKCNPYKGSSEEDFLIYINSLRSNLPSELEDIDYDTYHRLVDFFNGEMKQTAFSSTAESGENSWLEIGDVDPEYTQYGGFNSRFDTLN